MGLGQWQSRPVPGQDVFKDRVGYGKGCPWTCPFGSGDVYYNGDEYTKTIEFIDGHSYLGGVYPPNTMDLMKQYVEAFQKVSRKSVSAKALNYMSMAGMAVFVMFFLVMANQDIQRFVFGNW